VRPFSYIVAGSVREAVAALHEHGGDARILAGGTDLLVEWRRPGAKMPGVVIDISGIESLRGISLGGRDVLLGPLTTHAGLVRSDVIRSEAALLASAASTIGSPQIRNRGTLGGNIMNGAACADTVPPLIALGATVTLSSVDGEHDCHLSGFFNKPYTTLATPEELLTQIRFPPLPRGTKCAFVKLGRRNALSISRLSVAAVVAVDESGVIADARIVPGAAQTVWKRAMEAEKILIGNPPSDVLFEEAGRVVSEILIRETGRRWSSEYKEPVIAALVRRTLEQCFAVND
jgi:carbon-monoxide dehydrogenase medium subunit/xanthine dehydrogenase FAD-binding subunit